MTCDHLYGRPGAASLGPHICLSSWVRPTSSCSSKPIVARTRFCGCSAGERRYLDRPAFSRPNLGRYWREIGVRPSVLRALAIEGIEMA